MFRRRPLRPTPTPSGIPVVVSDLAVGRSLLVPCRSLFSTSPPLMQHQQTNLSKNRTGGGGGGISLDDINDALVSMVKTSSRPSSSSSSLSPSARTTNSKLSTLGSSSSQPQQHHDVADRIFNPFQKKLEKVNGAFSTQFQEAGFDVDGVRFRIPANKQERDKIDWAALLGSGGKKNASSVPGGKRGVVVVGSEDSGPVFKRRIRQALLSRGITNPLADLDKSGEAICSIMKQNTEEYVGAGNSGGSYAANCAIEFKPDKEAKKIQVSGDQQLALDVALQGFNLYIGGGAGTGKTVLLRKIHHSMHQMGLKVAMTATTGVASVHINGHTFHGTFGVPIEIERDGEKVVCAKWDHHALRRYDVVVIDEISMLSREQIAAFDQQARRARLSNKPFGGIQVILCGDFMQLGTSEDGSKDSYGKGGGSAGESHRALFSGGLFMDVFAHLMLTKNRRQAKDRHFYDILNTLRVGQFDPRILEKDGESSASSGGGKDEEEGNKSSAAAVDQLLDDLITDSPSPSSSGSLSSSPFPGDSSYSRRNDVCSKCGERGHWARDCPKHRAAPPSSDSSSQKTAACHLCGQIGHWARECPNKSQPTNSKKRKQKDLGQGSRGTGTRVHIFPKREPAFLHNAQQLQRIPGQRVLLHPQPGPMELIGDWTKTARIRITKLRQAVTDPRALHFLLDTAKGDIQRRVQEAGIDIPISYVVTMPCRDCPGEFLIRLRRTKTCFLSSNTWKSILETCAEGNPDMEILEWYSKTSHNRKSFTNNLTAAAAGSASLEGENVGSTTTTTITKNTTHQEPLELIPLQVCQDAIQFLDRAMPKLELKVGCQVMLTKNLAPDATNGSVGKVIEFKQRDPDMFPSSARERQGGKKSNQHENSSLQRQLLDKSNRYAGADLFPDLPVVQFSNGATYQIPALDYTVGGATADYGYGYSVFSIPLQLGYAYTVHKVQGLTLDCPITLDLRDSFFCDHLVYVACSRARALGQLTILGLTPPLVTANPLALDFLNRIPDAYSIDPHRLRTVLEKASRGTWYENKKNEEEQLQNSAGGGGITTSPFPETHDGQQEEDSLASILGNSSGGAMSAGSSSLSSSSSAPNISDEDTADLMDFMSDLD